MPMYYRGADSDMRRLVALSRDVDRQLAAERAHWTQQRAAAPIAPAAAIDEEELCCDEPELRYETVGHAMVCLNCGVTKSLGFTEFNQNGAQLEQRMACEAEVRVPYSRLKHFKKVLRDVTRAGSRVPRKVLERVRAKILERGHSTSPKITRDSVRAALRELKLYHYYTAENYIANVLGDKARGVPLTGAERATLLSEVAKYSEGFDRLRAREATKRRNFVNVHVLTHYLILQRFERDVRDLLRMPSEHVARQNRKLIAEIENEILFEPTIITARARMLKRELRA